MTADIETAGAMVTAGLVAHQLDQADGASTGEGHDSLCANCAAPLMGSFCHACGQRSHLHRSLLHLGEEVLHGILHFDAKAWRTLPLLVARPGELTRRYIDGQRTRFVSPLALFLFTIFFLFFIGSYFNKGSVVFDGSAAAANVRKELLDDVDKARSRLARKEAELAAQRGGGDAARLSLHVEEARSDLASMEKLVALYGNAGRPAPGGGEGDSEETTVDIKTGIAPIDAAIAHATRNPELAAYKIKNVAYKFSFLLVPISLPFMWLLFFWRRGVTMYDHAVFSLYSLSFMSLLFAALFVLKFSGLDGIVAALLFSVPPIHMLLQLHGAYRLTWMQALWRAFVLQSIVVTVFALYLVAIIYLSM